MKNEYIETNKLAIISRVLNNLGINDAEVSKRIADQITDSELQIFLTVFPIDGSEPCSLKKAREVLHLSEEKGNKYFRNVIGVIFNETGIMLDSTYTELIRMSEDDYERYYSDVVTFFINRGYTNNETILRIIRTVSVRYLKYFLEVFEGEKISQTELAKKVGISETNLSTKFSEIKELIKKETGLEIFGGKRKNIKVQPIEEYKRTIKEYFKTIGIYDSSTLETLSNLITQVDFAVFSLRYPIAVETHCKREKIAEKLGISFEMTQKSLERISDIFSRLDIQFSPIYKIYSEKCKRELLAKRRFVPICNGEKIYR